MATAIGTRDGDDLRRELLPCQPGFGRGARREDRRISREGKASALPHRVVRFRFWTGLLTTVVALVALTDARWDAASQAPLPLNQLVTANPPPNAPLALSPELIALTLPLPVAPESGRVRLLGAGGAEVALELVQVEGRDRARLVTRPRAPLAPGAYSVLWSARAATGGALLAGAYPFRSGVAETPGAARLDGSWPAPWAPLLRWIVFLGAALATGGFTWARLLAPRPGARAPDNPVRLGGMTLGALVAVFATVLAPLLAHVLAGNGAARTIDALRAMPLVWWIQVAALVALLLLCLGALVSRRAPAALPTPVDWAGVAAGLTALAAFGVTSHPAATRDPAAFGVAIAHQWSTALWVSGLLYFAAGWRALGSDVARFRSVRWIGAALGAVAVITGLAAAWPLFTSPGDVIASRYGQVLTVKIVFVAVVLVLGSLAMGIPRRSTALRASQSLARQGAIAVGVVFLAAMLALMPAPGTVAPATLAGVALAEVVMVDAAAFGTDSATVHLLTQPAAPGGQTLVVSLTDADGSPLAPDPAPEVLVTWTPLVDPGVVVESTALQPDFSAALFTGSVTLPEGWWQAEVTVTPPDGIATRALFWLIVPDPNVTGRGADPNTDPEAEALYRRGLASLTALRSVRVNQRLGDGAGALTQTRIAVSAAQGERPAGYTETSIDAGGDVVAQQITVGDRRWVLTGEAWVAAPAIPFLTPAAWSDGYVGAMGFRLGPRETVDGELSQIVTFWQSPREGPAGDPIWRVWWIGLASGQVRREATISPGQYLVTDYRDFDAAFTISPPDTSTPVATPAQRAATPVATPGPER